MMQLLHTIGKAMDLIVKYALQHFAIYDTFIYYIKPHLVLFAAIGKKMDQHHQIGCGVYFQWLGIKAK